MKDVQLLDPAPHAVRTSRLRTGAFRCSLVRLVGIAAVEGPLGIVTWHSDLAQMAIAGFVMLFCGDEGILS